MVETIFKNSNVKLVVTFGRTGGEHHPVLPQIRRTEDQIDGFSRLFFNSLHHTTPIHPTDPFPHLGPAKDPLMPPFVIDTREQRSCRHAAVLPTVEGAGEPPDQPCTAPHHFPLPSASAEQAQDHPEPLLACPACARARRAPWPTADGAAA